MELINVGMMCLYRVGLPFPSPIVCRGLRVARALSLGLLICLLYQLDTEMLEVLLDRDQRVLCSSRSNGLEHAAVERSTSTFQQHTMADESTEHLEVKY